MHILTFPVIISIPYWGLMPAAATHSHLFENADLGGLDSRAVAWNVSDHAAKTATEPWCLDPEDSLIVGPPPKASSCLFYRNGLGD